jgi:hypothetical protein
MKRLILSLGASVLALQLSACGINSNDDDQQAKASRNEEKLKEMYGPVTGEYAGQIKTASGPLGGKLILYTDSVQDGYDTNGAPLSHTVLKAQLKLNTVGVLDDHTFFVDYKGFDASATFSQKAASVAPGSSASDSSGSSADGCSVGEHDSSLAISNGLFRGDDFTGTLVKQNGTIGSISMHRGSAAAVQPIRDQVERLSAAYAPLLGTYAGRFASSVTSTDPGSRPTNFPIRLDILLSYVPAPGGLRCPVLITQYSRPDITSGDYGQILLSTSYNQADSQLLFKNSGTETSGYKFLTFAADWSAPTLDAESAQWFNYFGTLKASRCSAKGVDLRGMCCPTDTVDAAGGCCPSNVVDAQGKCCQIGHTPVGGRCK